MADVRRLAELGMVPELAKEVASQIETGGAVATWDTLDGKPAVIAAGADQAAARTAIGAGTSSLALGTTASTALAGNTPLLQIGTTGTTAMAGNRVPTTTIRGGVLQQAVQADSTATDVEGLVTDFNALLAKLRAAGVLDT